MARYAGYVPKPIAEIWPFVDGVAVAQGWKVGVNSTQYQRFYSKGVSGFSWGSSMTLWLQDAGEYTRVTMDTSGTSLVDVARARGIAEKLILALGGTLDA